MLTPQDNLQAALVPGARVQLAAGRYERPIRIASAGITLEAAAQPVEFWRSGIMIGGASNVLVRGLTFRQSPGTTLVIDGPAEQVIIEQCRFLACGIVRGSVTIWIGAGVRQAIIRDCEFDLLSTRGLQHANPSHTHSIAIMCAEKDSTEHLIERNVIRHYDYGIQLGASGTSLEPGRHTVRLNQIICPRTDGIHVKHGRCLIERNQIIGANNFSMSSRAGLSNVFKENEMIDGYVGISVRGSDHQLIGNRFIRMRAVGILLQPPKDNGDGFGARNTLLRDNQFEDCGGADAGRPDTTQQFIHDEPYPANQGVLDLNAFAPTDTAIELHD